MSVLEKNSFPAKLQIGRTWEANAHFGRKIPAFQSAIESNINHARVEAAYRASYANLRTDLVGAWGDKSQFVLIMRALRREYPELNLAELSAVVQPIVQKLTQLFGPFSEFRPR